MIASIINGEYADEITLTSRSFAFGDGVFETCKVINGGIAYWEYHLRRLQKGAQTLDISLDITLLQREIQQLLAGNAENTNNAVLKIIISRGNSARGYGFTNAIQPTRILALSEVTPYNAEQIKLDFCTCGYYSNPNLAGIKHQNRLEQILARKNNADCIMRDEYNNIISTTYANIFIVKDNNIYTPNLDNCGILGTRRAVIIDNFDVEICTISMNNVLNADEVFITNALIGVQPIHAIQHRSFKSVITTNIKTHIDTGEQI